MSARNSMIKLTKIMLASKLNTSRRKEEEKEEREEKELSQGLANLKQKCRDPQQPEYKSNTLLIQ